MPTALPLEWIGSSTSPSARDGRPIPQTKLSALRRSSATCPLVRDRRDDALRLAREHGACDACLFGPAARRGGRAESDLGLLVDMEEGRSLVGHAALKLGLEGLLGRKIGVVTERSLHPRLRDQALREAEALR